MRRDFLLRLSFSLTSCHFLTFHVAVKVGNRNSIMGVQYSFVYGAFRLLIDNIYGVIFILVFSKKHILDWVFLEVGL